MPELQDLVLCADDFGLSTGIDAGILALAEQGRLSATGCMVAGPAFEADAPRLRALADRIDIGLHFALTDLPTLGTLSCLAPPGAPSASLNTVLLRSLTGMLDYDEIKAEIGRQIYRFRAVMGRDPDFVDGHQHVHVFPGVRRALMAHFAEGTLRADRTWVRDCHENPLKIVARGISVGKTLFVSSLSGGLAARARRAGVVTNRSFRGITDFSGKPPYDALFQRFVAGATSGTLVMCHPASPAFAADPTDPIAAARRREFAYFSGPTFQTDLARAGVRLARMSLPGRARQA